MPTSQRRKHDNPPPRTANSESEVLRGFLDYLRASIAAKVDGAPEPIAFRSSDGTKFVVTAAN